MSSHNLGIGKYNSPLNQKIRSSDLTNKTILVIGASSGFGAIIVKELQNSNAKVLTTVNSDTKLHSDFKLNLLNKDEIAILGQSLFTNELKLDGVVNCAGIAEKPNKLSHSSEIEFEEVIAINFTSVYYLIKTLQPHLNNFSMFIQLAGGGASGPMKYLPAYSASKAGVVRLIETIAEELKESLININCLGPGPFKSEMTNSLLATSDPEIRASIRSLIPGKFGYIDPEHTAKCVSAMLSESFVKTSGKFFSAQWDDWTDIERLVSSANCSSSSYSLRRVLCMEE
jgi:3-oxoacyl-[acyl-carrier protein] reductase